MNDARTVLVTGGAGYIGSHTCVVLLEAGVRVVVIDNLDNSSPVAFDRVARARARRCRSSSSSSRATSATRPTSTAPSRPPTSVPSCTSPGSRRSASRSRCRSRYYEHNVAGTVQLLRAMERHGVRDLVFSSSCTVYGEPTAVPITEDTPARRDEPVRPHEAPHRGDAARRRRRPAAGAWSLLRYFNPVGAHPSGRIGEDPVGIPNNLMPYIMQVAVGRRDHLTVFGDDYPTPDGTAVRDYLHVVDLAEGHLAALDRLDRVDGAVAVNLGTGVGCSVLEVVRAASAASGRDVPYEIGPRRAGDVVAVWADAAPRPALLGWHASRTLADMCADHWRWQRRTPTATAEPEPAGRDAVRFTRPSGHGLRGNRWASSRGRSRSSPARVRGWREPRPTCSCARA